MHFIQENIEWWVKRLSSFYPAVYPVASYLGGTFFCLEVSQFSSKEQLSLKWCEYNHSALQLANEFDLYWNSSQSLQTEYQSLQTEYQTIKFKYNSLLNSKPVRIANKIKKIIGKTISE